MNPSEAYMFCNNPRVCPVHNFPRPDTWRDVIWREQKDRMDNREGETNDNKMRGNYGVKDVY